MRVLYAIIFPDFPAAFCDTTVRSARREEARFEAYEQKETMSQFKTLSLPLMPINISLKVPLHLPFSFPHAESGKRSHRDLVIRH